MSEETTFWFRIWCLGLTFVLVVLFSIVYTMAGKREVMRDMVNKGADPMRVSCALNMHEDKTVCVIDLTIDLTKGVAK